MGLNGVYFLINEQTGPQLSLCHMDAYVSYLGACLYPSYFLLFKGRMCNDEFCFLRHNCFVSFFFPISLLPCSGADYYDYGHGLSEETYDSYGEWLYELNDYSSRLLKKT